jgi:hypothetical protein
LLLLLQAVGWMGQFNALAASEKELADWKITEMAPGDLPADTDKAVAQTLADLGTRPDAAAGKVFRLARDPAAANTFMTAVRRLTFAKADEPHYYKYPVALFEDQRLVSPAWQPYILPATVYFVKDSSAPDSPVMQRARDAVRSLGR